MLVNPTQDAVLAEIGDALLDERLELVDTGMPNEITAESILGLHFGQGLKESGGGEGRVVTAGAGHLLLFFFFLKKDDSVS